MSDCRVESCEKAAVAKGLCMFHYKRQRTGRLLDAPRRQPALLPKNHPVYVAWTNMKTRCDNPRSTQFKWYGARGIHYCPEWAKFQAFYEDMFPGWQQDLVLDRKDNELSYYPDNCRWIAESESAMNRRSTKIDHDARYSLVQFWKTGKYTQAELAKMFGVLQPTISHLLKELL